MSKKARAKNTVLSGEVNQNKTSKLSLDDTQLNKLLGLSGADTSQRMVLEPRILLDAAGVETADTITDQIAIEQAQAWQTPQPEDEITANIRAISEADIIQENTSASRNEIVFIDSEVDDFQTLVDGIDPSIEVIILNPDTDGVEQIASSLEGRSNIDAIHIISHGRSGTLDLGSTKLTEASINGRHADEIETIKSALSENADILIYGCDFAAHARGASAVEALSLASGADVAASQDLTGAANLGGDCYFSLRIFRKSSRHYTFCSGNCLVHSFAHLERIKKLVE